MIEKKSCFNSNLQKICRLKWTYFLKRTRGPSPGSSEKAEPGPLEKADPIPYFTVWVKNSYLKNPRVLISNITIVFKIPVQYYPSKAVLVPNLRIIVLSRNFAIRQICGHWFKYDVLFSNSSPKIPK